MPSARPRKGKRTPLEAVHGLSHITAARKPLESLEGKDIGWKVDFLGRASRAHKAMLAQSEAARQRIIRTRGLKGFLMKATGQKRRALSALDTREAGIARKAIRVTGPLIELVSKEALERSGLYKQEAFSGLVKRRINMYPKHRMLFFDLDNFSRINETLGHEIGTRVIEAMARAIKEVGNNYGGIGKQRAAEEKGMPSTSSRYGGEEFSLHLTNPSANPVAIVRAIDAEFKRQVLEDPALWEKIEQGQLQIPTFCTGLKSIDFPDEKKQALAESHGKKSWLGLPKEDRWQALSDTYADLMNGADYLMKQVAKKGKGKNGLALEIDGQIKIIKIRE